MATFPAGWRRRLLNGAWRTFEEARYVGFLKRNRGKSLRPSRRLSLERLDDRRLLAGDVFDFSTESSGAWQSHADLTVSLVPDGTDVAGRDSQLFEKMGGLGDVAQWQEAVLRAFQVWSESANINFGVVADSGDPLGSPGLADGDARFGEVRIAAIPMSPDVLAVSVPLDALNSGTWAGDLLFNSLANFDSLDAVYKTALHEVGHLLGLSHSQDPASPMYAQLGDAMLPTDADVAELQQRYGSRRLDANEEESQPNDTLKRATKIRSTGSL
ncbi:MAG: matrixin family metalloprotease, partial [Planctomycetales bacterium]|nr:matrixin family metalloprotease [Planctomycetales bacterium]